jgi:glycerophosphoryl diester phosphodiesterase
VRAVLLAGLALGVLAAVAGPGAARAGGGPLVAAHRGGALLWPENSLLAFRKAVELGAEYLELDVHLSRDGEVVVIHDPTLDRTTTGVGRVRDQTLADLRGLRLRDRTGAPTDEAVPTLDEVARIAAAGRRQLLLEVKVDADRARYPGIEEKVLAVLDRHGLAGAAVVMAFERETWRRVRELRPEIRAGALYSARSLERQGTTLVTEMEEVRAAGVAFLGLHDLLITPEVVARARRAGVTLGAWTVNEAEAIRRVVELGVGIVISDRPDLARELRGR